MTPVTAPRRAVAQKFRAPRQVIEISIRELLNDPAARHSPAR